MSSKTFELVAFAYSPDDCVDAVDIIAVMAILHDRNCPWPLIDKTLTEFERNDTALIYCGSYEKCNKGHLMFERAGIGSYVSEI